MELGIKATPFALAAMLIACHSGTGHHSIGHKSFAESEPNDSACCPNYFGFLGPGDFLTIDGFITDSGADPFDGFAFTSAVPISVEFRLFIDGPFADLDVCLYDPYLGTFVDCFESPFNPEEGTVHVLGSGLDFHLVVNSFIGDSSYTLEVEAFPLFLAEDDGPQPFMAGTADTAGAVRGDPEKDAATGKPSRIEAFAPYAAGAESASADDEEPEIIAVGGMIEVDLETGEQRTTPFVLTSEGNLVWMGTPEED
ncbi:MAG: hypothetical protein O7B99_10860 [Planctomycetota bacterium]|nr:hypothetical protein [Planctomycetota bacterium]